MVVKIAKLEMVGESRLTELEKYRADYFKLVEARVPQNKSVAHEVSPLVVGNSNALREALEKDMSEFVRQYSDVDLNMVYDRKIDPEVMKHRDEAQSRLEKMYAMVKELKLESAYARFFMRYGYQLLPEEFGMKQ